MLTPTSLADRTGQSKVVPRARLRRYLLPFALVLPIVLYEGLLIVYPIAQGIYGSFTPHRTGLQQGGDLGRLG